MIGERLRLTYKQVRFEASTLVGMNAILLLLILVEAWRLRSLDLGACLVATPALDCSARQADFDGQFMLVILIQLGAALVTVLGALVLGVTVVGREVERRTTSLAWSLAPSRAWWLLARCFVLGLGVVVVCAAIGLAADQLSSAMQSGGRMGAWESVELRGPILGSRALAAFALAVTAGSAMGRVLPGLLIGGLAMLVLVIGTSLSMDSWLRSQAVRIDINALNTARIVDTEWRDLSTGRVMSRLEYLHLTPPPGAPPDWDTINFEPIPIGVPDSRVGDYVVAESSLLVGAAALLLGASSVLVERRRPY
jgi:hypothetical protein